MAQRFDGDSFSASGSARVKSATLSGPEGSRRLVVAVKDDGDDVILEAAESPDQRFVGTWRYPAAGSPPAGDVESDVFHRGDELALLGEYTSEQWGRGFWALRLYPAEGDE